MFNPAEILPSLSDAQLAAAIDKHDRVDLFAADGRVFQFKTSSPRPADVPYFISGSNHHAEVRSLAAHGLNVGVVATEVTATGEEALHELAGRPVSVFCDSGAFSEVDKEDVFSVALAKNERSRWMYPEVWTDLLGLYKRLACSLGSQLYAVAPDKVADQGTTRARLARYARDMREVRACGANIIAPVQKGEVSMAAFADEVADLLGFTFIPGIPMKKDATTPDELFAFLNQARPHAVHLLGMGPRADAFAPLVAQIQAAHPALKITCDSARIPAMVGPGRKWTVAQYEYRAKHGIKLGERAAEVKFNTYGPILAAEDRERRAVA